MSAKFYGGYLVEGLHPAIFGKRGESMKYQPKEQGTDTRKQVEDYERDFCTPMGELLAQGYNMAQIAARIAITEERTYLDCMLMIAEAAIDYLSDYDPYNLDIADWLSVHTDLCFKLYDID